MTATATKSEIDRRLDDLHDGLKSGKYVSSFITLNAPANWTKEDIEKFASIFRPHQQVSAWTAGTVGAGGFVAWRIPVILTAGSSLAEDYLDLWRLDDPRERR